MTVLDHLEESNDKNAFYSINDEWQPFFKTLTEDHRPAKTSPSAQSHTAFHNDGNGLIGLRHLLEEAPTALEAQTPPNVAPAQQDAATSSAQIFSQNNTIPLMQQHYQEAIAQLAVLREKLCHHIETDVIRLSLHIAKQVFFQDIQVREQFILLMVREALSLMQQADRITLHLALSDCEQLLQKQPDLFEQTPRLHIKSNHQLQPGQLQAECELGRFSQSIESRLNDMQTLLLGTVPSQEAAAASGGISL